MSPAPRTSARTRTPAHWWAWRRSRPSRTRTRPPIESLPPVMLEMHRRKMKRESVIVNSFAFFGLGLGLAIFLGMVAINVLLLAVGCFLDPLSAILLLSPLLVPIVKAVGIDGVHFGIVVTVNLAIGLFHPPFGINIFVAQSVLGLKLETIYRGIIPFVVIYLIALVLITYVPAITTGVDPICSLRASASRSALASTMQPSLARGGRL